MKLYCHPITATSRAILFLIKDQGLEIDVETVDIMKGAQKQPEFLKLNPNGCIPVLQDEDYVLTESVAIMRYLAATHKLGCVPEGVRERGRMDEIIDWLVTGVTRELAYHVLYPQLFGVHHNESESARKEMIHAGLEKTRNYLRVLDGGWLSDGRSFLAGDSLTLADYLGTSILGLLQSVGSDLEPYPRLLAWLRGMTDRPSWSEVNAVFEGFASSLDRASFELP
ncbi:MAG: glutathione S-transferase family protein [Myxococcota bacterium]